MPRASWTLLALAAVSILGSCAAPPKDSDADLLVDVKYGAHTRLFSQGYEIRVYNNLVAVFTGTRNVNTSGTHSYPISREQYEATLRLVKNSGLGRSEPPPPNPYFGANGQVTTRLDGITTTTFVGDTNLKVFLVFRKTLEDILGIRAYRCPYEAGGLELCALNDEFEEKLLTTN